MEGVKTCQELNHDGTICEESRTLKILEELQTLYAERLKRIDDEAGGDGVQLKITTMESWVQDLTIQNAILVHTVELLEHEASERVLLLQKRLQESSKSALEYMTKVQDYDSQMQEATGEKIRSQSQEISTRNQLILAAENEDALKSRIVRLETDIGSLLELIRRVREDNTWSIEGLHFYEVSYEDIFGYQMSSSLAADQHPYVSPAFVKVCVEVQPLVTGEDGITAPATYKTNTNIHSS